MKRSTSNVGGWIAGILAAALSGLSALLATSTSAEAETWYAQRVTTSSGSVGVEHIWSKGASLRSEVVVGAHPIVTVVHEDRYWIFDRLSGEGISVARHPNAVAADDPDRRPFGDEADRLEREGGEFVGDEKITPEISCRLIKLTDDRGRQEVCVRDDETRLPVFLKTWDRDSNRRARIQYVNWIKDLEIEGSFFTLDGSRALKSYSYEAYVKAANDGTVGPAPVLYPHLLHGDREQ